VCRRPGIPEPRSAHWVPVYVLLPSDGGALLRRLAGGADQDTLPAALNQALGRWTNSNGGREAESSPGTLPAMRRAAVMSNAADEQCDRTEQYASGVRPLAHWRSFDGLPERGAGAWR
jgi:hypothetical protein